MTTIRTKVQRRFNPHLLLLDGAQHYLRVAKERKHDGWYFEWLGAIVMSALSIESIGNCYGKVLIPNWGELVGERIKQKLGASPKWKLERVAESCGIKPDFQTHPWLTASQLTRFRDQVAHATRDHIVKEGDYTLGDWTQVRDEFLQADMEKMITEEFATKSCDAIEQIIHALNATLTDSQRHELNCRGHEVYAFVVKH
jgi:hypothetical protein